MKVEQNCRLINGQSSTAIVKNIFLLSITGNLQFFLWVKLESPSLSFRWSFLLVFSRGCSTYLLLLYGEGKDLGKKAKSCIISDKNAALVPISEFFLHFCIDQSSLLPFSEVSPGTGHLWEGRDWDHSITEMEPWADPICPVEGALGWVFSAVLWLSHFSPGSSTLLRWCRAAWGTCVTFMRWDKFPLPWNYTFHRHGGVFSWWGRFNFLVWISTVRAFLPTFLW